MERYGKEYWHRRLDKFYKRLLLDKERIEKGEIDSEVASVLVIKKVRNQEMLASLDNKVKGYIQDWIKEKGRDEVSIYIENSDYKYLIIMEQKV